MKVVFIHPPIPYLPDRKVAPPLGILYICAYLKKFMKDIELKVIDQNLNQKVDISTCISEVLSEDADIYAISFGTTQYEYAVKISKAIKETIPQAIVICGGVHAAALPEETINDTGCNFICVSEGEITMLELIRKIMKQDSNFFNVPGIYFKDEDGQGFYTAKREFIKNLDDIPFPARDLVYTKEYSKTFTGQSAANVITARGCPGKCIFCSQDLWKQKLRMRSVKNILAEIDEIYNKFGIRHILFVDDTLTTDRKRIIDLCSELKKRNIVWRGWTRSNYMNKELADIMYEAGCESLCIGVESGSQKILDILNKNTTIEQNHQAILDIKSAGIAARASIIVGSPGETWDTINETLKFIIEAHPDDWLINVFVPLPGSESFKYPERFGIKYFKNKNETNVQFYNKFIILEDEKERNDRKLMEYVNLSYKEIKTMRDYLHNQLLLKCSSQLYREDKKGFMFF